jgi:hypothetical protein
MRKPAEDDRIERLARAVDEVAYDGAENLWSAVMETADLETARSFYRAVKLLADGGDLSAAMNIVTGLFDLCEMAVPDRVEACRVSPGLMQMFLEGFLDSTDEYLLDRALSELSDCLDSGEKPGG